MMLLAILFSLSLYISDLQVTSTSFKQCLNLIWRENNPLLPPSQINDENYEGSILARTLDFVKFKTSFQNLFEFEIVD